MSVSKQLTRRSVLVAAAALALACSGSGGGGVDPNGDHQVPAATLASIQVVTAGTEAPAVPVGVAYQLKAIGTYSDGSTADLTSTVTWSTSDATTATVSAGLVTPVAVGTADLAAKDDASGVSGSVTFTVLQPLTTDPGTPQVAIVPDGASILIGTTLQLQALATLDDFSTVDLSTFANLVWTSSDETIATVSPTGLATAVALGTTTITATDPVSQLTASASLQVTDVLELSYVGLSRGSVIGGGAVQVTGTVYLTANALEDTMVTLSSNNIDAVLVPESVVVPAGQNRVTFAVTTLQVPHRTRVMITATAPASDGSTTTKTVRLNVRVQK